MKRSLTILITGAALAVAAPPVAAAPHHCEDLYRHSNTGPKSIFTRNITCPTARRLLRQWWEDPSSPANGPYGWSCTHKQIGRFTARDYCHRRHRTINFTPQT